MSAVVEKVLTAEERAAECIKLHANPYDNDSMMVPADIEERIVRAIREAVEEEREACAQLAESHASDISEHSVEFRKRGLEVSDADFLLASAGEGECIAGAIRARSKV